MRRRRRRQHLRGTCRHRCSSGYGHRQAALRRQQPRSRRSPRNAMALNRRGLTRVTGAEDAPVTFKVIHTVAQLRPGPNLDYFAIGLLRKGSSIRGFLFVISGASWIKLHDEDAAIHVPDPARREDGVWLPQTHPRHGRLVQSQEEDVRYGDPGCGVGAKGADAARNAKGRLKNGDQLIEGGRGYGKSIELRIIASYEEMLKVVWTISDEGQQELAGPKAVQLTQSVIEMVIDTASGRPPAKGSDPLLDSASNGGANETLRPAKGAIVKRVDCACELQATVANMPDGRYFLISVVATFDGQHRLRSRWVRAATLNVAGRDAALGCTDPGGNIRGKCEGEGCACQEFVPMGSWNLNSDPTVYCRRCGCPNSTHAIAGRAYESGGRVKCDRQAEGQEACAELPHEAKDWDERERNLWCWSNGALHPRENPHAARKRQAGRQCDGKAGRVSVVCPTMEERQVFHEQVWSCFSRQTWPDKELIVVETYQTRSSDVFRKIAAEDSRLIYLKFRCGQTTELSIGAKRNIAQHIASGDFIANFDDDDIYAPTYLSTMIGAMNDRNVDFVTLSSWYFFDIKSGRFGFFDAIEWAQVKKMREKEIDGWLWGYGFSYVHRLQPALDRKIDYPDQNMEEDIKYIRAWKEGFGDLCAALHFDSRGIALHTLHGRNTSNSFALREVPREEIHDTEFADLYGCLEFYLRMFPRQEEASKFIENEVQDGRVKRQYRNLAVHWLGGEFNIRCTRGANTEELHLLCAQRLSISPVSFRLYRLEPKGGLVAEEVPPQTPQEQHAADLERHANGNPWWWHIVGSWVYGAKATEYILSIAGEGELMFTGPHSRVGKVCGLLHTVGFWLQGEVFSPDGEKVGAIRLRYVEQAGKMISNYRSANREDWGKDIVAQRRDSAADDGATPNLEAPPTAPLAADDRRAEAGTATSPPLLPAAAPAVEPLGSGERLGTQAQEVWLVLTAADEIRRLREAQADVALADAEAPMEERASGEAVRMVVHIDQSLNLREIITVAKGSTIGSLKEELAKRDVTGRASAADFHLAWEGETGTELSDTQRISGVRTQLELCWPRS